MAQEQARVCKKVVAPYLTDSDLRTAARITRAFCGLGRTDRFEPVKALELTPIIAKGYDWAIVADEEWIFGAQTHGIFIPEKRCIYIHEAVYERACNGSVQDEFTIAHEIAHLVLYLLFGVVYVEHFNPFITEFSLGSKDRYGDPELQADAVAVYLFAADNDDASAKAAEEKVKGSAVGAILVVAALLGVALLLFGKNGKEGKEKGAA